MPTLDIHPTLLTELRRKAIHLLALIIPVGLLFFPVKPAIILLVSVTLGSLIVEVLRLYVPMVKALFLRCFGSLLRPHEESMFTGSTALLSSATICTLLLTRYRDGLSLPESARLSLFFGFTFVIMGDAAAAVFGKLYGRRKVPGGNKTWLGTFACFSTCVVIYFVSWSFIPAHPSLGIGLFGALLTALLEIIPIPIDDNLRVAPVTCFTLYALMAC